VISGSFEPSAAGEEPGDRTVASGTGEAPIEYLELCGDVIDHRSS
jgi:hypothetical protein